MSEADLVSAILQLLRLYGAVAWRTHDARHRPVEDGIPDIIACLPGGRFLSIEAKVGKGKLSPEQITAVDDVTRAQGIAVIARSVSGKLYK